MFTATKYLMCLLGLVAVTFSDVHAQDQTVVIVFDDSGSMDSGLRGSSYRRIDAAKTALLSVLQKLPESTRVGVLALNTLREGNHWIVPIGEGNFEQWRGDIDALEPTGSTPLGQSMFLAASALLEERKTNFYGDFRLLIVTDGEADVPEMVDAYLPQILARGIQIDAIGVDMSADHSLATRVNTYRNANNPTALQQAIQEVFAETSLGDDQAEEDFQLVQALPDGFAEKAIQALSETRRQPLVEFDPSADNTTGSQSTSPSGSAGSVDVALPAFASLVCCVGVFFGIVILIQILVRASNSNRRRR